MKTKIILIRHGQTNWNKNHLLDGQHNTTLTKEGLAQAEKLAKFLKQIPFDIAFSSKLSRAKKTLEIINKQLKIPSFEIEELKEIDCGLCTGLNKQEIAEKFPELIKEWKKDSDPPFPEGESIRDVEARVMPEINKIINENKGKTILIASHGTVNLAILGHLLDIKPGLRFKIRQGNCCVNEIDFNEEDFMIKSINRTVI